MVDQPSATAGICKLFFASRWSSDPSMRFFRDNGIRLQEGAFLKFSDEQHPVVLRARWPMNNQNLNRPFSILSVDWAPGQRMFGCRF